MKTTVFILGSVRGKSKIDREEFLKIQDEINSVEGLSAIIPHDLFDGVDMEALKLGDDVKEMVKQLIDSKILVTLSPICYPCDLEICFERLARFMGIRTMSIEAFRREFKIPKIINHVSTPQI
jgi:hypothetical protein